MAFQGKRLLSLLGRALNCIAVSAFCLGLGNSVFCSGCQGLLRSRQQRKSDLTLRRSNGNSPFAEYVGICGCEQAEEFNPLYGLDLCEMAEFPPKLIGLGRRCRVLFPRGSSIKSNKWTTEIIPGTWPTMRPADLVHLCRHEVPASLVSTPPIGLQ